MISIDYIEKNITAIIVIYDVTNEIFECIKNLQNIRKIIVDNGNCDKKIIQQIRKLKNIKYIRSKKNLGFGRANNFGLKYVNTKYTLLINADIKTSINDLVNLVKTLESYPNTAIAVPLLVDEKNKNIDHIHTTKEKFTVELPREESHGDISTNICLVLSKIVGLKPKEYLL